MNKTLLTSILLAVALLFGAGAVADSHAKFSDLDADGNGTLSAEEAAAAGLDVKSADADGDGAISEEEFKAAKSSMGGEGTGMEGESMTE
ncbi:EF-hand domain-containing protein [Halomonas nitroreducens]|uniref:EF-hand domain-containing protein n=1 Tax=Halomonas nitroreducens TaxID=447425 RepID=A0A3S0K1I6_9GAMM|nr:EF-hand domain-containing protein [Halomonas nitroreducens]RTR00756.1 EF-hand domain-containing protein [Halomonas nitroreducens]